MAPDLSISKSHFGAFFVGSTNAVYNLSVSNGISAGPTTGPITITDPLPTGMTFNSVNGPPVGNWTCSGTTTVTCTNPGPIAGFGFSSVQIKVNIAPAAVGSRSNTATVATAGDSNAANDTSPADAVTVAATAPPDLSISKGRFGAFFVGSNNAGYFFSISNAFDAGPTTSPITVTDTLPTGLTLASFNSGGSGWSCQANGQVITCTNPGPISQGGLSSFSFTVNVAPAALGQVTNTATVSTPDETNQANNSDDDTVTVTQPPPPDLSINITRFGTFFPGTVGAGYGVTVGSSFSTGATTGPITVVDTLPSGLTFNAAASGGTGWTCSGTTTVTCTNPGPIAQGAFSSVNVAVSISAPAGTQITNTATVSTSDETVTGNNGASDVTTIVVAPPPNLSLFLSSIGPFVVNGSGAGFSAFYSNAFDAGPTTGPITVTVTLPTGLAFNTLTSGGSAGWSCSGATTVTCTNPGPIPPVGFGSITFTVDVGAAALGQVTATSTIATSGETDTSNNSGSAQVIVTETGGPPTSFTLTATKAGTGTGTVTSSPSGIDCGLDCTEIYLSGTLVTLTATPTGGSTFAGWSGDCTVFGTNPCQVTMSAARTAAATFTAPAPSKLTLTVTRAGAGTGLVTSVPTGITCGTDCQESYDAGTLVTLSAPPSDGSVFEGWSGACGGTGLCQVTMDAAKSVTATFDIVPPSRFDLTVNRNGTGTGTVTSAPAGIICGGDCTESYTGGTQVALAASAGNGSTFAGWSGACTGTGACQVTMDQARTVTATFNVTAPPQPSAFTLTVDKEGTGSGTVTGGNGGIICGSSCSADFPPGTQVTLTATPADGTSMSTFAGWSGACTGTGSCQVTLDAAKTITATFQRVNVGVQVGPQLSAQPGGEPTLEATLSARSGCGPISRIQFGEPGRAFNNARVTIIAPVGGPSGQTTGSTYTPPADTRSVSFTISRVVQSGGATVSPIRLTDGCGEWTTFVGGGADAFR